MHASVGNRVLHVNVFYLQKETITVLAAKPGSVKDNHLVV